jgi:hypothetical protein
MASRDRNTGVRGNHQVWGRVQERIPDKTTLRDRERIAACDLREIEGRTLSREVWLGGEFLGFVRVTAGGQQYRLPRSRVWKHAAFEWGENDPKWGLAILDLLDRKK